MTTTFDWATKYLGLGLSVIPILADGSKRPALSSWKKYQSERADESTLLRWFGPESTVGLAVVCGAVSGGLEVLDFDAPEAWERWQALAAAKHPAFLAQPRVKTPAGGRHVYLRVPGREAAGNTKLARRLGGKTLVEVRGEGGYVLAPGCPPACHPTGLTYEWEIPLW